MRKKLNTYLVDYHFDQGVYSFELKAESWQDAEAKLEEIQKRSWIDGEAAVKIPVPNCFARLFGALNQRRV